MEKGWSRLKSGDQVGVITESLALCHCPDCPPPLFDPRSWWQKAARLSAALNQGCLCIMPCQSHIKGSRWVARSTLQVLGSHSSGRLGVPEAAAGYLGDQVLS